MVFVQRTAPPFLEKLLEEAHNPAYCLRLAVAYFSWRDEPSYIIALRVLDGLPGVYNSFCRRLAESYLGFRRGLRREGGEKGPGPLDM